MGRRKNRQGTMVLFLETDLEKAKAVTKENMSAVQQQVFSGMSAKEQEKVLTGHGTVVVDLETEETACKFNMENYRPPAWAIESFARRILPDIQKFYSHEENQRKHEKWKKEQDKDK